jgi:hypothetical protein
LEKLSTGCSLQKTVVKISNDEGGEIIDIVYRKRTTDDKDKLKFYCDFCKDCGFNQMSQLVTHQDQVHVLPNIHSSRQNVATVDNEEKILFWREKVGKIVKKVDKASTIDSEKYTCDDCGAGFNFLWRLEMHQVFVHLGSGENPGFKTQTIVHGSCFRNLDHLSTFFKWSSFPLRLPKQFF